MDEIDTLTDDTAVSSTERHAEATSRFGLFAEMIRDRIVELLCEAARQHDASHTDALRRVLFPRRGLCIE